MRDIPGLYEYFDPSDQRNPNPKERYNFIGVSTGTDSTERLMLCQRLSAPFLGMLILFPIELFRKHMTTGVLTKLEHYNVPIIKCWDSRSDHKQPKLFGVRPGLHAHFKDPAARYNVIGVAMHFGNWSQNAVYQPLYGKRRNAILHRPVSMFTEEVYSQVGDKLYCGPRFFRIEDISPPPHIVVEYQD